MAKYDREPMRKGHDERGKRDHEDEHEDMSTKLQNALGFVADLPLLEFVASEDVGPALASVGDETGKWTGTRHFARVR